MEGPVIAFDVSSGKSHMQGFLSPGKSVGKVVIIKHNKEDFKKIVELKEKIISLSGKTPCAVLEYTGVYSNTLFRFLETINMTIYPISPLVSAKVRKAKLRPTKTDKIDCKTIAEAFYLNNDIKPLKKIETEDDKKYLNALELSRIYTSNIKDKARAKCQYKTILDDLWPCFGDIIDYGSNKSIEIVKAFRLPQNIKSAAQVEKVLKSIEERGGRISIKQLAIKVFEFSKNCLTGACFDDSPRIVELIEKACDLQALTVKCEMILNRLIETVKGLKEYQQILEIPGIGENTASRLAAELGDVKRFKSAAALAAYVGVDPLIVQSGKQTGDHLKITKKGNKNARTIAFLIVNNFNIHKSENIVYDFVAKKKNSGLKPRAAIIAGCNKLLSLIYHMAVSDCGYKTNK